MSSNNLFGSIFRAAQTLSDLRQLGIHVEIGDDFSQYRSYRMQQLDRGPMYPMFDVARSYIDSTNGFWVCGFDEAGSLMHTQAVLRLDLAEVSLAEHLNMHRHKYITPDTTPDPDRTFFNGPDAMRAISGKVCYHGDFWLAAGGLGGPRSLGATSLLSRLLLELMLVNWNPDYVFALVPKRLAQKGVHLRYGYYHCAPGQWVGPDQQVTEEDHLIWMGAQDMANSLSSGAQAISLMPQMQTQQKPVSIVAEV